MNDPIRERMFRGDERMRAENEKLTAKAIREQFPQLTWGEALRIACEQILPPLGVVRTRPRRK